MAKNTRSLTPDWVHDDTRITHTERSSGSTAGRKRPQSAKVSRTHRGGVSRRPGVLTSEKPEFWVRVVCSRCTVGFTHTVLQVSTTARPSSARGSKPTRQRHTAWDTQNTEEEVSIDTLVARQAMIAVDAASEYSQT